MKKLTTLYKKNPTDLGRVINEIHPDNAWVFSVGIATRKFDGTSCAIIDGELYKRFDLKRGRTLPPNSIPCQEADPITGHHPHWTKCERNDPSTVWHFAAFDKKTLWLDGTYELCGEKVKGNPESIQGHELIMHGSEILNVPDRSFEGIKAFLETADVEGIVFHEAIGSRMCKIRKSDFGLTR